MCQASQLECVRDSERERRGAQLRPRPAQHRAYELASNKEAVGRSAGTSPQQLAQTPRLRPYATVEREPLRISLAATCPGYKCDHFPPPPLPTAGATHTQEPSTRFVRWFATDRARREQWRTHKGQMPL